MPPRLRLMAPWLMVALVIAVVDQGTKAVIEQALQPGESRPVTSFFNLVLAYNRGAAFSFLSEASGWQRYAFIAVALAAVALIVWLLSRYGTETLFCASLALILGGAVGNLWDRALLGHVVDFLDFHAGGWHWPAFNVADSAITVGAVLLIWDGFRNKQPGQPARSA
jgi:signal peptidase II